MLINLTGMVGGSEYLFQPGDFINTNETPNTIALDANYTYTGQDIARGDAYRTLMSAARTDTFPTANQLIAAIMGSLNQVSPPSNELYGIQPNRTVQLAWPANIQPFQNGSSFRRIITATTAFALTMAVPVSSGMSLGAAPYDQTVVAASSWREYVFQILNSSPAVAIACSQINANPVVTVPPGQLDFINNVTTGMSVYGTNVAAGTTVIAVNRDTGNITLSGGAAAITATIALNPITFTPTVVVYGLRGGPK